MGVLGGNPKDNPLHYGEIYDIWQCSMMAKGFISTYRLLSFHAGDKDLKQIIESVIDQAKLEAKECDELLEHNGMVPPPYLPDRPEAKLEDIPAGARYADQEIAAIVSSNLATGIVACSQIMSKSIREDVGALFLKYHTVKTQQALRMLRVSKEKGWLMPPPLQIKRPDLVGV